MIDEFDKLIETELLKRISEKGKVNLMTEIHSIMNSGKLSCLSHSSLTVFVQKQFLESNLLFKYKLLNSRNGIKIVELSESYKINEKDLEFFTNSTYINEKEAMHLFNQFSDVLTKVKIEDIAAIYKIATCDIKSHFVCLNDQLIKTICKDVNCTFESRLHIEKTIKDIINYGYCFKRNDQYYWKIYMDTSTSKEEIEQFFTVNELDLEENKQEPIKEEAVNNKDFTAHDALNLLAKELGFSSIENTRSKLEEVIAITNELIDNFNSMQDWEKLMNWNNFVNDWKMIMGDALNDND